MAKYNVLYWDFNSDKLKHYDVIPHFVDVYKHDKLKLKTKQELKDFVKKESRYHYWARCEYEMILRGWPVGKNTYKLDIDEQINMNIDYVVDALADELNIK